MRLRGLLDPGGDLDPEPAVLVAGYAALLHRLTGENDLADDPTFAELTERVRRNPPDPHDPDPELATRYRRLLTAAIARPDTPISALPILDETERDTLLAWSEGPDPGMPDASVPQLVSEQVARTPDALAASDATRRLTYRELDLAAGRLAGRLRDAGVRAGDLVAVVLARSVDLVVAQLAILRAGATVVPLDPTNPPARLHQMLDQAEPKAVIASQDQRLPGTTACVLTPDAVGDDVLDTVPVHPDQLAYVTYTSGSTGAPKGVMLTHRSLASTVAWARRVLGLTPADRAGMTASPGFDVSVLDTFTALTAGASLHAPAGDLLTSPGDLQQWLTAERVTVTFLPTPLGETMLGLAWPGSSLRRLHTGGAVLHQHPVAGLPFDVLNLYGVTEVGVWSTAEPVEPGRDGVPSIGRPIDRAEVLVLDSRLEPVPAGVLGEVYLGGVGVARGYLGRPGMTADRFVPHPWRPGARLYRTGDRARWRPDGTLGFVGRTDHQVQSSGGVRVELGEIEAALTAHPAVGQAVAAQVDGRLVGYVASEFGVTAADLRDHLAERLPRYMVPADFVVLDRLPLTATGKIDRRSLPEPPKRATTAPYEPPRTDLERELVRIWQSVLGSDRVGIHDSFFDVGGNSTSLVQVYGHLVRIAAREVSLVELYEHPTIAAFAEHLTAGAPAAVAPAAAPARPDRAKLARLRRGRVEGAARD